MKNLLELGKQVKQWYVHSITDKGMITLRSTIDKPTENVVEFFNTDTGKKEKLYTPSGGDTIYACAVIRKKLAQKVKDPNTGKMVNKRVTRTKKELLALAYSKKGEKVIQVGKEPLGPNGDPLFVWKNEMCMDTIVDKETGAKTKVPSDTFQWLKFNS
tara:strand:- start:3437 stop:3910 length:474 start_codon:yes stop_codon:yes gene_type:complete